MSGRPGAPRACLPIEKSLDAFLPPSVGSAPRSGDLQIRRSDDRSDAPAEPGAADSRNPGSTAPDSAASDWERLERAVLALASRYAAIHQEQVRLTEALGASERRVAELEAELREANQLRSDVAKRVDDLVGQIDQIETRFAARGA